MLNLLLVTAASAALAYGSQKLNPSGLDRRGRVHWDICMVLLVVVMTLFSGLRTGYNDTLAYITSFQNADPVSVFLSDPENLDILHNPLFYFITSLFRQLTDNYHLYLMAFALFNTVLFVRFLRRYAPEGNFAFVVFLYFAIGVFTFSMAALKQITASAVLTLAIPALVDKKWGRYYLLVAIAGLLHTYAFIFAFLPLLSGKPWGWKTLLLLAGTLAVMLTFEDTIGSILEYADSMGKHVAEYEVFDGNQMNPFRVAVFAVVPVLSLVFRPWLAPEEDREKCILLNMSIVSLMFMLLAMMNGANMFGRLARYFVLGSVCTLPWILDRAFNPRSAQLMKLLAAVCFLGFFLYDNQGFSQAYYSISLTEFIFGG